MARRTYKTALLLSAGLSLGLTLAPVASAAPLPAARKGIEANYARFNAAFMHKDLDTMFATLAPDFVMTMPGKTPMNIIQTRQLYDAMVGSMKTVDTVTQTIKTIQSDRPDSREATATTRMLLKFTGTENKKDYHAVQTSTWRDTFVRTAKGWLLRRADNLTMRMTVDGKTVTP